MPCGYTDSEWARMGVKSVSEITREKVRELHNDGPEEKPVEGIIVPKEAAEGTATTSEVFEINQAKVEEVMPVAKKRGRPAKASKMIRAKEIVILEAKKEKKIKRGKR